MKKAFVIAALLMLISVFSIQCTKSTKPEPVTGYQRNVVIELFTYHSCLNCPFAEQAIDSLYSIYGDSMVVIEYHKKFSGDILSPCTTFVDNRDALYGISGFPTVVFDGVEQHIGGIGDLFTTYLNIIKDRFSKTSELKVQTFEANFVGGSSISFNLGISAGKDISGKLFVVLTEDSVMFNDSLYHFVAKQVFPSDTGNDFSITASNPFSISGSIPLSWQPTGDVLLNIFIQDMGSKTIYQGGSINLGKVPSSTYQFNFSVSPDTFQTVTAGSTATFDFFLKNTGTVSDSYLVVATQLDTVPGWAWVMYSGGISHMPAPIVKDTFSIVPGGIDTFDIKVTTNSTPGTEKINVEVTSFGDTTVTDAINIYTKVTPPPYQFNFSVSPNTFQIGTSGEPTVFSFLLSNTGSDSDRYYIEANQIDHIPGWDWQMCYGGLCKIPDHGTIYDTIPRLDTLPIAPQESDSFTVDVIPDTTSGTEKINVKVTSAGDTTLAESINIYTELQLLSGSIPPLKNGDLLERGK